MYTKNAKIMNKVLFTSLFCISFVVISDICCAQDIIFLRNGEEIESKVIEVLPDLIKYNKWTNQNGPLYSIDKSEVFMIKYPDGSKDVFERTNETKESNSNITLDDVKKDEALKNVRAYVMKQFIDNSLQMTNFCKTNGFSKNSFEGNIYTIYIDIKAYLKSQVWLVGNGLVGYWRNNFHVYTYKPTLNDYERMTNDIITYPRGMKFIFSCEVETLEMDNGYSIKKFKIKKVIEDGLISNTISSFEEGTDIYIPKKGKIELSSVELVNAVSDVEGNRYRTVVIGSQTWMKDNLRVSHYKDGINLSMKTDAGSFEGSYCWPQNNKEYKNIWGALYDGNAIFSSKLCPEGWHIPSQTEWIELFNYLGGPNIAGSKLKKASYWSNSDNYYDKPQNDECGFDAIPAGYKSRFTFQPMGMTSVFWTSTKSSDDFVCVMLEKESNAVLWFYQKPDQSLLSVRCIKDSQNDVNKTDY